MSWAVRSGGSIKAGRGPYDLHSNLPRTTRDVRLPWAALTSLELVTGIIILPQRQTALVPETAAEVDLLTGADSVSVLVSDGTPSE